MIDKILNDNHRTILLVARLFMAALFIFSGTEKALDITGAAKFAEAFGVPFAHYTIFGAILLEIGSAIALITTRYCRQAAGVLALWMMLLNPWFHRFWAVPPQDWQMMIDNFFHHFVMIGGMLYIVVYGTGAREAKA